MRTTAPTGSSRPWSVSPVRWWRAWPRTAWTLDALNLLPRVLQEAVPVYASAYLVNLGSLGAEAPFHHLYQRGTASVFASIGTIRPEPVVDDSGAVVARRRVDVVDDPARLMHPPDPPDPDGADVGDEPEEARST